MSKSGGDSGSTAGMTPFAPCSPVRAHRVNKKAVRLFVLVLLTANGISADVLVQSQEVVLGSGEVSRPIELAEPRTGNNFRLL